MGSDAVAMRLVTSQGYFTVEMEIDNAIEQQSRFVFDSYTWRSIARIISYSPKLHEKRHLCGARAREIFIRRI